jgi:peptidoglycan hydrolase CwlO-like protein
MDVTQLLVYQRNSSIPSSVRDAIGKAISLKNVVTDLDRQIAARTQDINSITAEQGRIRENMKTVSNTTQYYQRLLAKLNEQESTLESLHTDRDALTAKRDGARKELEDYLSNLTIY